MGSGEGRPCRVMHTDPSHCRAAQRHQDGHRMTGHAHAIVPQRRRECTRMHGMYSPVCKAHALTVRLATPGGVLGDHAPNPVWSPRGCGIPMVLSPDVLNDVRECRRGHEDTPPFHDCSRCVPVLVLPQWPSPTGSAQRAVCRTRGLDRGPSWQRWWQGSLPPLTTREL
jgi:hypothetical protein